MSFKSPLRREILFFERVIYSTNQVTFSIARSCSTTQQSRRRSISNGVWWTITIVSTIQFHREKKDQVHEETGKSVVNRDNSLIIRQKGTGLAFSGARTRWSGIVRGEKDGTRERRTERSWAHAEKRDEKGAVESATRVAWGAEESGASTNQSITSPHATPKGRWADI